MDALNRERLEAPSTRKLMHRLRQPTLYALGLLVVSLIVGMAGYHWFAGFGWVDAFENTAMLLGGMGPIGDVTKTSGKIFAGVFALYAGILFLVVTALVLSPVFHHILHRFHWETRQKRDQ